jgi:hypothetical protein
MRGFPIPSEQAVGGQNVAPEDALTARQPAHIGTYGLGSLRARNAGSGAIGMVVKRVVMCV